jgi:phosphate transport system substrate-binding protein
MVVRVLLTLNLVLWFAFSLHAAEPSTSVAGHLTIAGNGPEVHLMETLARAFEKVNSRAYVDIVWNEHSKPIEMVKSNQADLAVTGKEEADLPAKQIAWDGIAVMVNQSNLTKDVTTQQVADLFSGKIRTWSDLGGPETRVLLIDRPRNRNIRDTFEEYLGITGKIPETAKVIGPDDKVIKTVAGTLPPMSAVSYVSLGQGLDAVTSGVAVRLLPIDKVEPEEPTVKDGRYKLRRPVLLVNRKESTPLIDAFYAFTVSPAGQKIIDAEGYTPLEQKP